MSSEIPTRLQACLSDLPNLRVTGCREHKFMDILIIAVCGTVWRG